jgi:exosortase/archaeosortase family protein
MNEKKIYRFLALMLGSYGIIYLLYELWLREVAGLDSSLIFVVGKGAAFLLQTLSYETEFRNNILIVNGFSAVAVGAPCNGFLLYVLHFCFSVAVPGATINKFWYIPLGFAAVYLANVVRVALLALNVIYFPDSFEFNHHYLFTTLVYLLVFGIWVWWFNRFSGLNLKNASSQ